MLGENERETACVCLSLQVVVIKESNFSRENPVEIKIELYKVCYSKKWKLKPEKSEKCWK